MTTIRFFRSEGFEWDETKNQANVEKHGISFERATQAFDGTFQRYEDNRRDYGEKRYRCVGMVDGELFAVIYTERNSVVRIISARRARRDERREYRQVLSE